MIDGAMTQAAKSVAERAAARAMAERRWRVWTSVGLFVGATALMVVLAVAERDQQAVRGCRMRLTYARDELQKALAEGQVAPLSLPLPPLAELRPNASAAEREQQEQELLAVREHYFYNLRYGATAKKAQAVGVCCCRVPHDLHLRADGRHVLIFDGQHYEVRWMTETEFDKQATKLGLNVPPPR